MYQSKCSLVSNIINKKKIVLCYLHIKFLLPFASEEQWGCFSNPKRTDHLAVFPFQGLILQFQKSCSKISLARVIVIVLSHMEKYLCLKRHGKASGLEDRIGNLKTRLAISFVSFFSRLFLRRLPHTSSLGLPDPGSAPAQLFDTRMCCQWTASSLSPLGERWPGRTEQRQVETAALPSRIGQAWSIGLWKLFLCSGKWIWSSEIH